MTSELQIKNFKKITEQISLSDFAYVNYLVGENGSGKTSILNSLSFLPDYTNARNFFGKESIVNFFVEGHSAYLTWNPENPNRTESHGDMQLSIHVLISNIENEKGANNLKGKAKIDSVIGIGNKESLNKLNEFFEEIGHEKLTARKFVDQDDPFNQDNGQLIFETSSGTINPTFIADGIRAKHNLKNVLNDWVSKIDNPNSVNIFIIEEPENNLHPNFQKEIPHLFNSLYEGLKPELAKTIIILVSTHSPFIVSASAKFSNQKIYPLQNGKLLEFDLGKLTWSETNASKGYRGAACAYIVSKMLGADITDLGYPHNYGILEEYSLQIILDDARNKGLIKNIQFVSSSGISKAADFSETIYEIEKLNTLIKCNPYYFDKYFIIIDSLAAIDDVKLKTRFKNISNKIGRRFVELKLNSLEDYYSNLDVQFEERAKAEIQNNKDNPGMVKAKYARLIIDRIIDRETFSKLFNSELDFLLL